MWFLSHDSVIATIGTLVFVFDLTSMKFSYKYGIFHLLQDLAWGDRLAAFSKRIDENFGSSWDFWGNSMLDFGN